MDKHRTSYTKKGSLIGFVLGAIFVTCALSCPLPVGNGINEGTICNDAAVGIILHYPFLISMIVVGIPVKIVFKFDILDSNILVNILIWIFGVGLYTIIGSLLGWTVTKLKYFIRLNWSRK